MVGMKKEVTDRPRKWQRTSKILGQQKTKKLCEKALETVACGKQSKKYAQIIKPVVT